jgi:hypothetical protein
MRASLRFEKAIDFVAASSAGILRTGVSANPTVCPLPRLALFSDARPPTTRISEIATALETLASNSVANRSDEKLLPSICAVLIEPPTNGEAVPHYG